MAFFLLLVFNLVFKRTLHPQLTRPSKRGHRALFILLEGALGSSILFFVQAAFWLNIVPLIRLHSIYPLPTTLFTNQGGGGGNVCAMTWTHEREVPLHIIIRNLILKH